jgi:ligand-binding SRPBCC domain-containing protein
MEGESMARIETQIRIDRPLSEVFELAINVDRWRDWQTRFLEVEQTSAGPFGDGTTFRTVSEAMGKRIESLSAVTEFSEGQNFAFEGKTEAMSFHSAWTFEDTGDGTRLLVSMDSEPREGAVLAKLVQPWLTRVFRKRLEADLEGLKLIMESDL